MAKSLIVPHFAIILCIVIFMSIIYWVIKVSNNISSKCGHSYEYEAFSQRESNPNTNVGQNSADNINKVLYPTRDLYCENKGLEKSYSPQICCKSTNSNAQNPANYNPRCTYGIYGSANTGANNDAKNNGSQDPFNETCSYFQNCRCVFPKTGDCAECWPEISRKALL